MRHSLLLSLFLSALVGLTSCGGNGDAADDGGNGGGEGDGNTILIGHYASLTGGTASFGQQTEKGMRMAVDEINAAGGVLGKKIELITEDTRSQTSDAGLAAEKLISSDKVAVLLGEVASSLTLAAVPIAEQEQVPMVTPAATNLKVTVDENNKTRPNIFRICFIDPFQAAVMAKFAREQLGMQKVAIFVDNANAYSVGLAGHFREEFEKLGGTIVEEQAFEAGQVDFKSQLTGIRTKNPDGIYVPGYYGELKLIGPQARELGITVPLLGGDGWDSPELTEGAAKEALEGCFFSNHYAVQDTAAHVASFTKKYQETYGELPGAMSALGYDAMMIVADAIKRAGSADRAAIRKALEETKDFKGVTGTVSINDQHNAVKSAVIIEVKNGQFAYRATMNP